MSETAPADPEKLMTTCARCGLHVSAGICARGPLVFHDRPEQCVDAMKSALASQAAEIAELKAEASKIARTGDDGGIEVWYDGHTHSYHPTSTLRGVEAKLAAAEATIEAMRLEDSQSGLSWGGPGCAGGECEETRASLPLARWLAVDFRCSWQTTIVIPSTSMAQYYARTLRRALRGFRKSV